MLYTVKEEIMKLVINALAYKQNSSGIGVMISRMVLPVCKKIQGKAQIILSKDSPEIEGFEQAAEVIRSPHDHRHGLKRMWFQTMEMGRTYGRNALLLTTDSKIPFFLPQSCRVVSVVTDLAVFHMGEVYKLSRMLWWRFQYCYLKKRATHYVAVSEFTKQDMVEVLGIDPEHITVVHCAADERMKPITDESVLHACREKYGLDKPYVLFVGNNNPRKNLSRMMEAFDLVKQRANLPHQLVIAGEQGWKFSKEGALQGISCKKEIRFLGFVSDEDLPALYTLAELFAFPTLYEGFGIPVIEAQQCGTPVLSGKVTAMPEVGGEGAFYVDPYSVESIAAGMERILTAPSFAEELRGKGFENAKRFSWEQSVEKLRKELERWM